MSTIKKNMIRDRAPKSISITDEQYKQVNKENRRLAEEWLNESTHLSPNSISQYKSAIKIFLVWIHETFGENKQIHQIKKKDYLRFQNSLIRRGLSSGGVKLKRSCISSFCKYIINFYEEEEDYLTFRNFVDGVPNPTLNKVYEKVPVSEEESQLIIKQLTEDENWQLLALYYFMYISGCRRGEIVQVRREILDYAPVEGKNYYWTHKIRCKGKGLEGESRPIMFDDKAREYVNKWMEARGEDDNPYLFVTKYNKSVNQIKISTVNDWFANIISDIVGRRVNPHITRASRSTDILNSGLNIKMAQKLLGHKDSSTTEKFYDLREDQEDMGGIF
ncbi:tyrosine-type recombinase/integrase [Paenibacillus ferrarius]|nr:site-specific integrase [Paenibacillus ferrarius]